MVDRAVRGATQVDCNSREDILNASAELVAKVIRCRVSTSYQFCSGWLLDSGIPVRCQEMGLTDVSLMRDAREARRRCGGIQRMRHLIQSQHGTSPPSPAA